MTTREVELTGGAPWGFRMHGGADHNQPLRISRVNPGRKASLSGIREGDVISSINGQPTRAMSNADAHSMLRSAGPVLRLGLNEDKEMSPRRRSIGRASDLRRSSHLLSEINNDVPIPQAPVYATIRPAKTSQHRPPSSLTSLPAALNATDHIRSETPRVEPIQFHPTNPFYTLPNGKNDENLRTENTTIPISISDSDLHKNEQEINRISVTEHEVSETEEIKTIKKIVMNGSTDNVNQLDSENLRHGLNEDKSPATEHYIKVQYSPKNEQINSKSTFNSNNYEAYGKYRNESTILKENQPQDVRGNIFSPVDTSSSKSVATKPPLKSPSTPSTPHSLPKRE
ncbi:PREDICTED: PDZ and LIM domain protein 4-like [Papilio polytes]|uniref:PDZ and LIM domain protein 4-like n=1 Tax=Papilio polytes TaxID=76194 RepID=UPI000675F864|nr:PREDICTED: PDZ and LIM domain protein 4-like [Papilio polytes]